jgi:hypothetical protein
MATSSLMGHLRIRLAVYKESTQLLPLALRSLEPGKTPPHLAQELPTPLPTH